MFFPSRIEGFRGDEEVDKTRRTITRKTVRVMVEGAGDDEGEGAGAGAGTGAGAAGSSTGSFFASTSTVASGEASLMFWRVGDGDEGLGGPLRDTSE